MSTAAPIGVWRGLREGVEVEFSAHDPPRSLAREIPLVFGRCTAAEPPVVCPILLRCRCDIVFGNRGEAELEKDRLLRLFARWTDSLRETVMDLPGGNAGPGPVSPWIDGTDPSSGMPFHETAGPSFYPDVHGAQALLGYATLDAGGCGVLSHPEWGTAVYPVTVFARGDGIDRAAVEGILAASLDEPPRRVRDVREKRKQ